MKRLMLSLIAGAALCGSAVAADTPQFPGGKEALDNYISSNVKYPATAKENGIEGVVNVTFTVQPDGSIGSIKIVRMVDPDLEQEAIRVVKSMPAWEPAEKDGTPVAAGASVAIPFTLE